MLGILSLKLRTGSALVIYLVAAAALGGCTTMSQPAKPSFMRLGQATFAPLGYLEFCTRRPDQCPQAVAQVADRDLAPATAGVYAAKAQGLQLAAAPAQTSVARATLIRSERSDTVERAPYADNSRLLVMASWTLVRPNFMDRVVLQQSNAEYGQLANDGYARPPSDGWTPAPMPELFEGLVSDTPILDSGQFASPQTRDDKAPSALPSPDVTSDVAAMAAPDAGSDQTAMAVGSALHATPQFIALLNKTNQQINAAIKPVSLHGAADRWDLPLDEGGTRMGDCKDYALQKREALIDQGVSASDLSIAVVLTRRGEHHAVLIVTTAEGEYVLDNLTSWVTPWGDLNYTWLMRQVPAGGPTDWVGLDGNNDPAKG